MAITITKLSIDDWSEYKALRLKALKEDPIAFTSSFEDSMDKLDDYWISHLNMKHHNSMMLFAKDEEADRLVGMVALIFNDKKRTKHVAELAGNYVDSDYRRRGIGSMMMEAIIHEAKENKLIKKINLSVVATQEPAVKLYEKFGFKKIGTLTDNFYLDEKYYDLVLMENLLK